MSLFDEFDGQGGRAVLLSIKPRYAELILAGSKTVELRRSWPSNDVGVMVLYASAPVQRLVGIAYVKRVEELNIDELWTLAQARGGGVTKEELVEYFEGKRSAFGIIMEGARTAVKQVEPKELFPDFVPPQSFLYLKPLEFRRVLQEMELSE